MWIYLMTQSKTNIAKLAMMRQREENQPLQGDVRVDDAYLGGGRTGGKAGRGVESKVAFVVGFFLPPWRHGRRVQLLRAAVCSPMACSVRRAGTTGL
ncbi:hypothetical protein CR103_02930 [Massilia psychrophila]|uniref:ISXO2-like transposase domain-containing protein n=1 Tax=Massilia psychrophila TaxID=1603353 RepID=A0A2G8T4U5_9BURK|nr:hypothetical protein CR103_02930 [Massilia psychrophila]GGE66255.1 hypothetical protein GCM10008020_08280 [Massilia psychrophila]